jgi:hypothetical protein
MPKDKLTPEQAQKEIAVILETRKKVDCLTAVELVRRGTWSPDQFKGYLASEDIPYVHLDDVIRRLSAMETNAKKMLPIGQELLEILPSYYAVVMTLGIEFDLMGFFRSQKHLPTTYELDKALYKACIVRNHTPKATDRMTFSIFFDADEEGREDWHYSMTVAVDEYIIKDDRTRGQEHALEMDVLLTTFSGKRFPDESAVAESLKKNQLAEYPNSPVLEVHNHIAADFARYHLIADLVRQRRKSIFPNHPLNFLEKEG